MLASITETFTAMVGWVGTIGTTITNTPVLMIGLAIAFTFPVIGYFWKLLRG